MNDKPEPLEFIPPGTFGLRFRADAWCGIAKCGVGVEWKNRASDFFCGGAMTVEQATALRDWLNDYLAWRTTQNLESERCSDE